MRSEISKKIQAETTDQQRKKVKAIAQLMIANNLLKNLLTNWDKHGQMGILEDLEKVREYVNKHKL